ncbi:PREDICTED: sodium-coupled monocarboxylate transporter 2-like [Nicrophorus vespilloides]|uniref:Sodium-coupled monocarboxylate transporter 2-like n=1 Tax=Nicrophorus vespilloides TaxID=110193 RepID=A0ABM1M3E2_NICVS|nr:PREDICTED: sodium-coupled monocarboxylate transporter 2-like [Nicrophorus vespilloides]
MDVNVEEPLDPKFLWYDYALFSMMLLFSAGIGIYYGFFGKKKEVVNDYLLGGKEMSVFPIAMSLTSSVLSAVSLTAIPADIYRFGATYWLSTIGIQFVLVFVLYAIIPVFYNLQLTSIYEYVELRFHRKLRIVCSILYAVYQITFLPIIIYLPALAIAQGTGFNIHYITMFFSTVCIFYTTIGGFKAVIWTDTMQFVIMAGTAIMITVIGTSASGGFQKIWEDSLESGRFHIDFDPDPRKRDTFWTICVGLVIYWFQYVGVNQSCIQKCISLPSMAHIKK